MNWFNCYRSAVGGFLLTEIQADDIEHAYAKAVIFYPDTQRILISVP